VQGTELLMKEIIQPSDGSLPSGPWSQGVKSGNLLYVSGQVGEDADGKIVDPHNFQAQAEQAFENVKKVVEAAGGTIEDIVKIAAFLTDVKDLPVYNQVRTRFFKKDFPASTTVVVKELAQPIYLLEIEAYAVLQ
jgi:2-iminobutanoate/2-iminopropanoate deaminase